MAELVVLAGVHAVKHAVRFGAPIERLVSADPAAAVALMASVAPDVAERLTTEPAVAPDAAGRPAGVGLLAVELVSADEVVRLGGGRADLVGLARRPVLATAPAAPAVLLDNPRHLGNLGAVVRVAAGFGARAVLTTGTVDPWHPTVVRAAAGLHYAVDVRRVTDLPDRVIAFDPEGDDLRGATIPADAVLAFGSERHGLSPQVRSRADQLLAIPMQPEVSSYNLATSVAVALYAWTAGRSPSPDGRPPTGTGPLRDADGPG